MKHPATIRPLDALLQTASALVQELCTHAQGWVGRLRAPEPLIEAAVTIDLDNVIALDDLHGFGSSDHAVRLMARALEEMTSSDDFVARTGPTAFSVIVKGADRIAANALVDRVRYRFDELLRDAGYECDLALSESPVAAAPEVDEMIDRSPQPKITILPSSALYLN